MNLRIWDVQHGSAAHLQTPTGENIVIDLGVGDISESDASFSPLRMLMRSGVVTLDEVIITHPHRDHLDDIFVFDSLSPRVLRRPRHLSEADIRSGNRPGDDEVIDKYLEIDRRYSAGVGTSEDPEAADMAGMQIVCFHPSASARTNLNNHSIVTFMRYANSTVCLPGDNEGASWNELLESSTFRQWLTTTDVFVASHHGREAGYCDAVFQHCRPVLVVVSDGPGAETSAVDKYRARASGWTVWSRPTGQSEQRWVLTTRRDGSVYVTAGWNDQQPFLMVSVE